MIIQEFIETADAVGSVSLYDKYDFNVSPATIRNEMAALVREGYLSKPHSSAGRVPTSFGLRYFLEELLSDYDELDVVTQEQVKQQFHQNRFSKESLIRQALAKLTEVSSNASVALVDRDIYYAGLSDMLSIPEFQEIDKLRQLLIILEDYSALSGIFSHGKSQQDVKVLIGTETGLDNFDDYAVVFSELRMHGGKQGYIAVIGPNRMNYARVIPAVRFVSKTIASVVSGW